MDRDKLATISEKELLSLRICDLKISLRQTSLMRSINDLYFELNSAGINFLPHIWVSSDWFSPDGIAGFALPFYLLHPRLIELEKKYIGHAEGADKSSLMKFLRHETGHAIDNAYHLRKSKSRQKLFGLTSTPYPTSYLPISNSKEYVRNLGEYYAQAHPDEDWAETFAVWLDPKSNWETKYKNWKAINKLNFVQEQMISLRGKNQLNRKYTNIECFSKDTRTIHQYLREKRKTLKLNKKSVIEKVDIKLISFVNKNKKESKKIINTYYSNKFISEKITRDISKMCKSKKITLNYSKRQNIHQSLLELTDAYIKEGRHKVIM